MPKGIYKHTKKQHEKIAKKKIGKNMILIKRFTFEAGHYLPGHPKCGTQHGHSWSLEIHIEGQVKEDGMVMDFSALKDLVDFHVLSYLDHKNLNDEFQFVPTCENLAIWIWNQLIEPINSLWVKLVGIKLCETSNNCVFYYEENKS